MSIWLPLRSKSCHLSTPPQRTPQEEIFSSYSRDFFVILLSPYHVFIYYFYTIGIECGKAHFSCALKILFRPSFFSGRNTIRKLWLRGQPRGRIKCVEPVKMTNNVWNYFKMDEQSPGGLSEPDSGLLSALESGSATNTRSPSDSSEETTAWPPPPSDLQVAFWGISSLGIWNGNHRTKLPNFRVRK